jgi:hypothetical protein
MRARTGKFLLTSRQELPQRSGHTLRQVIKEVITVS